MGGGNHQIGALQKAVPEHGKALLQCFGAVIHTGQDMAVKIDHGDSSFLTDKALL